MTHGDLPDSTAKRLEAGRQLHSPLPVADQAVMSERTRDALTILDEQNSSRIAELITLRTERMAASSFAFYRGAAAIMAADLANEPHTGILVPSCGDAHLANFGFYASTQRTLMFDLNDFDEAAWAPWEWDLKRLVTSVILSGQVSAREESVLRRAAIDTVRSYAIALDSAASLSPLDRFYHHIDAELETSTLPGEAQQILTKAIKHAKKRTSMRAAKKLAQPDPEGRLQFVPAPPTMIPFEPEIREQVFELQRRYLVGASPEIRQLLRHYTLTDAIRRVVGVGSVGTRCALTLMQDGDGNALVLQSKQAVPSVLEQYGGVQQPPELTELVGTHGQGARVVGMQRILQSLSDPFLGSLQTDDFDLFVRQFHDMKGGIDAEESDDISFAVYARACGVTLARAHSQSPHAATISGYLGNGQSMGEALWQWGLAYAERTRHDHAEFKTAGLR